MKKNEWSRLFEKDETAWRNKTIKAIDRGRVEDIDLFNIKVALIEMSASERSEVKSRMHVLMMHLLKAMVQPSQHTRSWNLSILNARRELKNLFGESKVLRAFGQSVFDQIYLGAVKAAIQETGLTREQFWNECPFSFGTMMNDRFGIKDAEDLKK